jgi:hypothetical protein
MNCLRCNLPLLNQVKHYGQHFQCFQEIFRVSEKLEFDSLARKESSSKKDKTQPNEPHLTSYFAGNYKKYEGKLGQASYILKLSKAEYPELSAVEYVCNKIAYYCGLVVPTPFTLIEIENSELAFVSKNFMHTMKQHAALVHIHHYLPNGHKNFNVEILSRTIYEHTHSVQDVKMFFKTLLYDALVGNHDRHGGNLAFIETAKSKRLSPIYDNPSYLGLESGAMLNAQISPKGKIWTRDAQEPSLADYLLELERLGVSDISHEFFDGLDLKKIMQTIEEAVCLSDRMKTALKKLIGARYNEWETYAKI